MNRVINFHDVYDKVWFEQTLLILKRKYNIVDIKEVDNYFHKKRNLKNACLITVDDGDKTFYDVIFPILKKHKVPAVLFVSPEIILKDKNFWFQKIKNFDQDKLKYIISDYSNVDIKIFKGYSIECILKNYQIKDINSIILNYQNQYNIKETRRYNINLEQLEEIDKSELVTIGAHTQNHPILANENDKDSMSEIFDSIDVLAEILGHDINYFAYPNGQPKLDFTKREIDYLKRKKIKLAFSTRADSFKINNDCFAIPRFGISYGGKSFVLLKLFLGKYWETIKKVMKKDESYKRNQIKKEMNISLYSNSK